ncbi:hypothetical protein BCR41DRAFT_419759 [Lobosporangium transversale]|uniref:F-box domain-containing protein n=1 Tax=Lobosporangium transversale TaxID=64571 RepID=A0A1Y2GYA7_9FUNG|nr:hypothetical protein BCR41DRAFT_419759 [Lobosporangium transversale]ORZ26794.1 hypothetical protein BCR41DRAFT_419759 [Lobosporangium transversale]|eukprot:XP_021884557.1 hypothetical protein BCR41DRAFT_419759 [Lobosporangium transversale]
MFGMMPINSTTNVRHHADLQSRGQQRQLLSPLDLPLILEEIGAYLPRKDLYACSLVCRGWYTHFAPSLWWLGLYDLNVSARPSKYKSRSTILPIHDTSELSCCEQEISRQTIDILERNRELQALWLRDAIFTDSWDRDQPKSSVSFRERNLEDPLASSADYSIKMQINNNNLALPVYGRAVASITAAVPTSTLQTPPHWPGLHSVRLQFCWIDPNFLSILLLNCPNLETLQLQSVSVVRRHSSESQKESILTIDSSTCGFTPIAQRLWDLEVTLENDTSYEFSACFSLWEISFKNIKGMDCVIQSNNAANILRHAGEIEAIHLESFTIHMPLFEAIQQHKTSLTSIILRDCHAVPGLERDILHHFLHACSALERLTSTVSMAGSQQNIFMNCDPAMFEQWPWTCFNTIKVLDITPDCEPHHPEDGLNVLARSLSSLTVLDLRGPSPSYSGAMLTEEHAERFMDGFPKLKEIWGLRRDENEAFFKIVKQHRRSLAVFDASKF